MAWGGNSREAGKQGRKKQERPDLAGTAAGGLFCTVFLPDAGTKGEAQVCPRLSVGTGASHAYRDINIISTNYPQNYPHIDRQNQRKRPSYPQFFHGGKKPWPEMESFQHHMERNRDIPEKNRGVMERTKEPGKGTGAHRKKPSTPEFFQGGRIPETLAAMGFGAGGPL